MPHTCTKSRTDKKHERQPNRRAERQRRAAERAANPPADPKEYARLCRLQYLARQMYVAVRVGGGMTLNPVFFDSESQCKS